MLRIALRQHVKRSRKKSAGDIDRNVLRRRQPAEQAFGLFAIAGAQINQHAAGSDARCDLVHMRIDNRTLGAHQRILGQLADRLEQPRSERVIKIFRRNERGGSQQRLGRALRADRPWWPADRQIAGSIVAEQELRQEP